MITITQIPLGQYQFSQTPNPIAFLDSTNYAKDRYTYFINLFVWKGATQPVSPNYIIKKLPLSNGLAYTDLSSYLKDFTGLNSYRFQVFATYVENNEVITVPAVTSDIYYSIDGYNIANYDVLPEFEAFSNFPFMTDITSKDIPNNFNFVNSNDNDYYSDIINISSNNPTETLIFTGYYRDGSSVNVNVTITNPGGVSVLSYILVVKNVFNNTQGLYRIDVRTATSNTIRYNISDTYPCDVRRIDYMNRYGVWENVFINYKYGDDLNVERGEYYPSKFNVGFGGSVKATQEARYYNTQGYNTIRLNTGWLHFGDNNVYLAFLQLFLSDQLRYSEFINGVKGAVLYERCLLVENTFNTVPRTQFQLDISIKYGNTIKTYTD